MIQAKKHHHEIAIHLHHLPGNILAAVPKIPHNLLVGESVSYSSPAGSFRVEFPDGSLFESSPGPVAITNSEAHTLLKAGTFDSHCFITLPGGEEVGWSVEQPQSGGVHDVKKAS